MTRPLLRISGLLAVGLALALVAVLLATSGAAQAAQDGSPEPAATSAVLPSAGSGFGE